MAVWILYGSRVFLCEICMLNVNYVNEILYKKSLKIYMNVNKLRTFECEKLYTYPLQRNVLCFCSNLKNQVLGLFLNAYVTMTFDCLKQRIVLWIYQIHLYTWLYGIKSKLCITSWLIQVWFKCSVCDISFKGLIVTNIPVCRQRWNLIYGNFEVIVIDFCFQCQL